MRPPRLALLPLLALSTPGGMSEAWSAPAAKTPHAAAAPRLLLGALSAPAPGREPRAVAQDYVLSLQRATPQLFPGELAVTEVLPAGVGHVVRFVQSYGGVPVFHGELSLRIGADGQVLRLVRDVLDEPALRAVDLSPQLQAAAAREAVRMHLGPGRPSLLSAPALYIDLETVRLVWVVPSANLLLFENALYVVDARSGEVLRRIERLRFMDQFKVFRSNPVEAAQPEEAALPADAVFTPAAPMMGGRTLSSALLSSRNCIDKGTLRSVPGFPADVHLCELEQLATANLQGDFDGYQPLVRGDDGKCPTDKDPNPNQFAEAHMYFHAAAIYDRFRGLFAGLGRPDFRLRVSQGANPKPLFMVVDLCLPDFNNFADAKKPLNHFENAFFSPGGPGNQLLTGQDGDAIAFGMGSKANFALDGDVIYHEFTHAVVYTRSKLETPIFDDERGRTDEPGAMNEGLADFFSAGLDGDSVVGEYAGRNFGSGGIRDVDNKDHCTDNRIGETHEDSKAFSGALWAARRSIAGGPRAPGSAAAARRDLFDQAVLAALDGLGPRPSMADMGKLLLQELELRADKLGADAKAKAEQALTDHGILPQCERVLRGAQERSFLCLDGDNRQHKAVPGYLQWRINIPAKADTLSVTLDTSNGGCSGGSTSAKPPAPVLHLLLKAKDEPIVWSLDDGDEDQTLDLDFLDGSASGKVTGLAAGIYHVMLTNTGGGAVGRNIFFATRCSNPMGCKGPDTPPVPMDPMKSGDKMPKNGGCGCRVGAARADRAGSMAALALLALIQLRRRRGLASGGKS